MKKIPVQKKRQAAPRARPHKRTSSRVYLDHAAATPLDPRVLSAMTAFEESFPANPSSAHREGVVARRQIETARGTIAELFLAHPDEIVFTGNATEANYLALKSAVERFRELFPDETPEIVLSVIEHSSVRAAAEELVRLYGAKIIEVPVGTTGLVDLKKLREVLSPQTAIVSVMYGNNEIGTIEPIREVVRAVARMRKDSARRFPLVHSDACQAVAFLDIGMPRLGVDYLVASGAKVYGPKGVGVLVVRRGAPLSSVVPGEQESSHRGGTEWGAGIIGAAYAFAAARKVAPREDARLRKLGESLMRDISKRIPGVIVNTPEDPAVRLPHIVHFSVPGFAQDFLALALDARGFAVSTGSACTNALGGDSRVILALKKDGVRGGIRVSLGRATTAQELRSFVSSLAGIIKENTAYRYQSDL